MCGIAGFFDRSMDPREADARLRNMLDSIRHRGPDGEGRLVRPALGIHTGMRRLSIIDLEGGDQPIWNENRDIAVLFNGEIYNYRELRTGLESCGHSFRTSSDTEVLVHLYEEHGEQMVRFLRGMFAFLIIDLPNHRAIIARDPFGQKPLYHTSDGSRFAFASELKSLRHLPWVEWEEDPDAYLMFLTWLSLPAPWTHFRKIRKLEPGACLSIDLNHPGSPSCGPGWSYLDLGNEPDISPTDEEVESVLRESVRLHLRSDVPVGVFLSGGLDSKLIATLASQELESPVQTFTAVFDGVESEETEAEATAGKLRLPNHKVPILSDHLGERLQEVMWHLDEPVGDPAAFAVSQLAAAARKRVKVVLSGEGADELFGGYFGRYHGMLSTIERSSWIKPLGPWLPKSRTLPEGRISSLGQRAKFSVGAEIAWMRREGLPCVSGGGNAFTPAQQRRILELCEELGYLLLPRHSSSPLLDRCLAWDIRWQLPESLLQKADKMTMAHSLELRAPFLDIEVARIASRVGRGMKLDTVNGVGKSILRKVAARMDPSENPARPKKGFPMPFADWFRGPLRGEVEDCIFHPNSMAMERCQRPALKAAWKCFQSGSDDSHMWPFYSLWVYELWKGNSRNLPMVSGS